MRGTHRGGAVKGGPGVDAKAVRRHYARLAPSYEGGANRACERAYVELVRDWAGEAQSVLELGCGSMPVVRGLPVQFRAGCDISLDMLRAGATEDVATFVADGQALPCRAGRFEAAVSINVLEHVADPRAVLCEMGRLLAPGGVLIAVTPNGNLSLLLELLERLHMKLPEGPHRFLTTAELAALTPPELAVVAHKTFLAVPAGPAGWVRMVDACVPYGLFQYLVARKRKTAPA